MTLGCELYQSFVGGPEWHKIKILRMQLTKKFRTKMSQSTV